jgi:peroxiredoxin
MNVAPLRPGDRAPDITLPSATGEGTVALAPFRGRQPVLLALFRGLY